MTRRLYFLLALVLCASLSIFFLLRPSSTEPAPAAAAVSAPAVDPALYQGFARATGPMELFFPGDHGPHPDYQTEWWYYTGNLLTAEGRHFGYQLTFFRRALLPAGAAPERQSDWGTRQAYMAHFALTDSAANEYHAFERLERGAAGLAGAQSEPFRAWLGDWEVSETAPAVYRLHARAAAEDGESLAIDLELNDVRGPVLQGDRGYSQKGPDPGQASYYYSLTRLESNGTVTVGGQAYPVSGLSWMDHEFSTSVLSPNQVGWDWLSLQVSLGAEQQPAELMLFQIRQADGSIDPFSSGTLVYPDGSTRTLKREDFTIAVTGTWKSPHSGAEYPAGWRISAAEIGLELALTPVIPDQELNLSYSYWEGAVTIEGTLLGEAASGRGYVELTGYSGSMSGEF
ncbi:MAG TPA: lipocalin-like domain-containing protein [Anaerolineales bacterium]|nr:lipocalin-like domain-containing protein [Anaerolineales bacterium]